MELTTRNKKMKITKNQLKRIIQEEIGSFLKEGHEDDLWYKEGDPDQLDDIRSKIARKKLYPHQGTKEFDDQQAVLSGEPHPDAPTSHDEQMVNDLLNQIGSLLGHDMPDVVGLEAEQLAGAVSDAIERWKKKQQLSPTGKSNAGTGLPRDPKTPEPVKVEWE